MLSQTDSREHTYVNETVLSSFPSWNVIIRVICIFFAVTNLADFSYAIATFGGLLRLGSIIHVLIVFPPIHPNKVQ